MFVGKPGGVGSLGDTSTLADPGVVDASLSGGGDNLLDLSEIIPLRHVSKGAIPYV